jgi:nicotinate phosphoribosyltransferase
MAYGYWKNGLADRQAVFHLFFRKRPFGGGFCVASGLESIVEFIEKFRFSKSDLDYLSTLKGVDGELLFTDPFLEYLLNMKFNLTVDAVPEGSVMFPYEPMVRVEGPLIQAQLLETPLLNQINFPSLIATKAARVCLAAEGQTVMEFGLRRAQGIDGALTASRAAFVGGCHSTSNVLAGKLFGIPVAGTHSHSWVMIFDQEKDSFEAFAKAFPGNSIFLVDTYNTLEGVKSAIEVGKRLKENHKKMIGIRLDSGDLGYLSKMTRKMLDEAGLEDAKIVASNELDETVISDLRRQGAKIDIWGVGTHLVTAKPQPALDGVYKLSATRDPGEPWKYRLKLSEQMTKISNPGILQVRRYYNDQGNIADAIYDINSNIEKGCHIVDPFDPTRQKWIESEVNHRDLLVPIFREGKLVYSLPSLQDIRENTKKELSLFHEGIKRFINPHQYPVGMEKSLYDIKVELIKHVRKLEEGK